MDPLVERKDASPPVFLRLAGHPVRWRLMLELARSDRHVRELCGLLGRPQNLVSYHLGQLRKAQLVRMRRSSADARDAYYSANLSLFGEGLASTGARLHPGLRFIVPPLEPTSIQKPARVLFLCTGNSARSQIAEALLEHLSDHSVAACSAGSHPKTLHPNATRVMRKRGIDLRGRRAKHLNEFIGERFDYVISLCDRVREVCPEFPDHPKTIHWSMADPSAEGPAAFERTAVELEMRIGFFIHLIRQEGQSK